MCIRDRHQGVHLSRDRHQLVLEALRTHGQDELDLRHRLLDQGGRGRRAGQQTQGPETVEVLAEVLLAAAGQQLSLAAPQQLRGLRCLGGRADNQLRRGSRVAVE
eukprot:778220-Pyramimonas_sp.AAC.2